MGDARQQSAVSRVWGNLDGRIQIIVAVIGVIGAVLATVLSALFTTGNDRQAVAAPPTGGSSASPTCTARLRIVAPPENEKIADGNDGTTVKVVACGLHGDTGWLFDFDPSGDQKYYLDGSPPFAPVAPSDGIWSLVDQSIGSPGEVNTPHTIYLVDASPSCARTMRAAKPDADQNVIYKTLPAGCTVVDSVDVTMLTYPSMPSN